MKEFVHLSDKLKDPEYLHLLLEPIMIYGLAIGVLVFLFSFIFGERKMQLVGLGVIIVSSMMVMPYLNQRQKADERIVKVRTDLGDVEAMLADSTERRRNSRKAYVVVATLAGLTVLMGAHKGKPGMLAGVGTAVAGIAVVVHGAWLHLEDAEIYHPNIRVVERADGGVEGRFDTGRDGEANARASQGPAADQPRGEPRPVSNPTPAPALRRAAPARPRP